MVNLINTTKLSDYNNKNINEYVKAFELLYIKWIIRIAILIFIRNLYK
jgi:hypothetical protein